MTVADLRQLLTAMMEANKATAEAGQANALRITEINSALDKLALTQKDLVRSASKVESTIDRVIQANIGLDRSVEELKQSMERVATRLTSMETTAAKLSTPESVDRDQGPLRPEGHCPQHCFQGTSLGEDLWSRVSDLLPTLKLMSYLIMTMMTSKLKANARSILIGMVLVLDYPNLISLTLMAIILNGGKRVVRSTLGFTMFQKSVGRFCYYAFLR